MCYKELGWRCLCLADSNNSFSSGLKAAQALLLCHREPTELAKNRLLTHLRNLWKSSYVPVGGIVILSTSGRWSLNPFIYRGPI